MLAVKKVWVAILLTGLFSLVVFIFWHQELKYAMPTVVPVDYKMISPGDRVTLPPRLSSQQAHFLHFYNPDCPCSRFNARHIQSLVREHKDSISFAIVVMSSHALDEAKEEFGDDLIYLIDYDGKIANACGVYSTPQAAIIDHQGKLYYRGNYNKARYCTARASNFAELSLIALINKQPAPIFGLLATESYGCELNSDQVEFF